MDSDFLSLVRALVETPSENPPGNEAAVVSVLEEYLDESVVPFDVEIYDVEPNRPNVVARVGEPSDGSILFTGHLDVVPADAQRWEGDPFTLRRDGEALIGRGIADMKGAVAAMVRAVEDVWQEYHPPGEMQLAFVMGEETGGIGSASLVERGIEADVAVLGEPTDLQCCTAQKGVVRYRVSVEGASSHASVPDGGVNAVRGSCLVLEALTELDRERRRATAHELLTPETITPTLIDGGTGATVVPGEVTFHLDWRIHPGENGPESYDEILNTAVSRATAETPFGVTVDRYRFIPGLEIPPTSSIVRLLQAATRDVGLRAERTGFNATTDARYFVNQAGLPTALFGPGSIERDAHTANESIRIADLDAAYDVYYHTVRRFFHTDVASQATDST